MKFIAFFILVILSAVVLAAEVPEEAVSEFQADIGTDHAEVPAEVHEDAEEYDDMEEDVEDEVPSLDRSFKCPAVCRAGRSGFKAASRECRYLSFCSVSRCRLRRRSKYYRSRRGWWCARRRH